MGLLWLVPNLLKAPTDTPIFGGLPLESTVELANYNAKSANSRAQLCCSWPIPYIRHIYYLSADYVGQREKADN